MWQPQKSIFWEKPKVEKYNNFTFHDYFPQFCSENKNWLSYKDGYVHFEN